MCQSDVLKPPLQQELEVLSASVMECFYLLESLQDKYHFEPRRIYNVYETEITTVQGVPFKRLVLRGKKQVDTLTSAERGTISSYCLHECTWQLHPTNDRAFKNGCTSRINLCRP